MIDHLMFLVVWPVILTQLLIAFVIWIPVAARLIESDRGARHDRSV